LLVVISAGQVIVGAVSSATVIRCSQEALPALLVAVQVIIVVPAGYGAFNAWPSLREPETVTFSPVVVGWPGSTVAWQLLSTVADLSGGHSIVGAPVSSTVMVKVQLPPPVSEVAVTVCGEPSTEKNEPDSGVEDIEPHSPELTGSG
jgi:hypothetical protein